jgi:hypothetical protein
MICRDIPLSNVIKRVTLYRGTLCWGFTIMYLNTLNKIAWCSWYLKYWISRVLDSRCWTQVEERLGDKFDNLNEKLENMRGMRMFQERLDKKTSAPLASVLPSPGGGGGSGGASAGFSRSFDECDTPHAEQLAAGGQRCGSPSLVRSETEIHVLLWMWDRGSCSVTIRRAQDCFYDTHVRRGYVHILAWEKWFFFPFMDPHDILLHIFSFQTGYVYAIRKSRNFTLTQTVNIWKKLQRASVSEKRVCDIPPEFRETFVKDTFLVQD